MRTPPVTEDALLRHAGEIYFDRGLDYYDEGRVRDVTVEPVGVTGTVQGTWSYRVTLRRAGARLEGACTCPVGQSGGFCKHCVAVGLAWLDSGRTPGAEAAGPAPADRAPDTGTATAPAADPATATETPEPDLVAFLRTLDHPVLVDLLAHAAEQDPRLQAQLRRLALASGPLRDTP